MHVVATAGHVDHGKSTLVRALTGTDPDRLAEEKARGLTIDLGFASSALPSGRVVSFIDVPGHIRFLKNMLAGVGGVDACVFVVAATEGWKPQSEEHLRILELLGIKHGIIALTKVGMADDELVELAKLELADSVAGTFLSNAPIVAVDALSDIGLDDLRNALDDLLDTTPTAPDHKRPRLWIDRVFAAKGSGTIVTGTLTGGVLRVEDELTLVPQRRTVRIRALQSLHKDRTKVGPGNRVAANLSGVSHLDSSRGDGLIRAEQWHLTNTIDAELTVLDSISHPVTRRGAYMAYIGSGEVPVRLRVLGPHELAPGSVGAVRLHLPVALPLTPGDRFIIREAGRGETIGGGEVLDIDPVTRASKAAPDRSVDRVIAERGRIEVAQLALLTGQSREPDVGRWAVAPDELAAAGQRVSAAVDGAGPLGLDLASFDEFDRAVLDTLAEFNVENGRVTVAAAIDPLAEHPFVAALEANLFAPPSADDVDRDELRELVKRGQVVQSEGIYFAAAAITEAARGVAECLARTPEGVTVADVRDTWGSSRKFTLPLLLHLDAIGVTRRRGDVRIAGPRLPALD